MFQDRTATKPKRQVRNDYESSRFGVFACRDADVFPLCCYASNKRYTFCLVIQYIQMARTKQTARRSTGGITPRKQLARKSNARLEYQQFLDAQRRKKNGAGQQQNQQQPRLRPGAISLETLHSQIVPTTEQARVVARARYVLSLGKKIVR